MQAMQQVLTCIPAFIRGLKQQLVERKRLVWVQHKLGDASPNLEGDREFALGLISGEIILQKHEQSTTGMFSRFRLLPRRGGFGRPASACLRRGVHRVGRALERPLQRS